MAEQSKPATVSTGRGILRGLPVSRRWLNPIGYVVLFGFLALVPVLPFTSGDVFFWTEIVIFILFASSLNLLIGYSGMVSFGHAAYYGAGVYAVAYLISEFGFEVMLVNILAGTLAGAVLAAFVGALIVRTAGLAFAILTLAFGQLAFTFIYTEGYFGGENGLSGIIRTGIGPIGLAELEQYYYFCLAVVFLAMLLIGLIVSSPLGLTMKSIREDAGRAEFLGMRVRLYKLAMFTIAGSFAGLAGSLRAYHNLFAAPEEFGIIRSAEPIIMSILGGMGTLLGPAIGAIGYKWIEDWLQNATPTSWILWIGLLLVMMIIIFPGGLIGSGHSVRRNLAAMRRKGMSLWRT